ncbi:GNAT family N-acetyltransferase [[Kitasatospora] papulosa]|uniref:GNAT family N-acetyltransferase n=1 Tax=[Kitasatospora] papulosa TaxID=1464011 RepID=UPI0036B5C739
MASCASAPRASTSSPLLQGIESPGHRVSRTSSLQDIERAAGQSVRDVGTPEVAEDEPLPVGEQTRYRNNGPAVCRMLLDHLADRAVAGGVPALTLSTIADVAWNAPDCTRRGFLPFDDHAPDPELREIRRQEAAHGVDRWPRSCMRGDL